MKKWLIFLALAALAAIAAACGGSSTAADTVPANAKEIVIKATNFKFDQAEYRVKKGETVNFVLENEAGNHGVKINGLDVNLKSSHKNDVVTLNEAGTYEIECSLMCGVGHRDMVAKLIVE
ncbi:cytochrome C oxidase subunit II [Paenibacillus gansuensis]|uniref:Cytochrome C oxidase subunit II n=1 Tax=Paenibacillus gansuensis TaxID=306542 RepID=A0ABW5PG12_9BACL